MRRLRPILAITALALMTSGIGVMAAAPANAAVRLGGVNPTLACQRAYPTNVVSMRAVFSNRSNAYSWFCQWGWFLNVGGVDMNLACRLQYGSSAYAGLSNSRDVYAWYCQR